MLVNDYTDDTTEQEDVSEENKQENEKAQNLVSDEHGNQENTSAKSAEASAKHIVLNTRSPNCQPFTATSGNTLFTLQCQRYYRNTTFLTWTRAQ